MWVTVARWLKKEGNEDEIMKAAEAVRDHWREVSMDQGFDPDKAVTIDNGETELRVGIAEDVDKVFREGPGGWR
jgi:hypothetical protein